MSSESTNIKIDRQLKKEARELFDSFGLSLSAAVNIFLRQSVLEQAIPFRIGLPEGRGATLSAMDEVRRMKGDPGLGKTYTDVDKMMEELLEDEV